MRFPPDRGACFRQRGVRGLLGNPESNRRASRRGVANRTGRSGDARRWEPEEIQFVETVAILLGQSLLNADRRKRKSRVPAGTCATRRGGWNTGAGPGHRQHGVVGRSPSHLWLCRLRWPAGNDGSVPTLESFRDRVQPDYVAKIDAASQGPRTKRESPAGSASPSCCRMVPSASCGNMAGLGTNPRPANPCASEARSRTSPRSGT